MNCHPTNLTPYYPVLAFLSDRGRECGEEPPSESASSQGQAGKGEEDTEAEEQEPLQAAEVQGKKYNSLARILFGLCSMTRRPARWIVTFDHIA